MANRDDLVIYAGDLVNKLLCERFSTAVESLDYYFELRGAPACERDVLKKVLAREVETIPEIFADRLRKEFGGERFTIKKTADKNARRAAVLADYTGRNADEVMRKHNISRATFYRYISGH